jgi:hypothetical protein
MVARKVTVEQMTLTEVRLTRHSGFGLCGSACEIDLNKKNAAKFRQQLEPFIQNAHKVGSGLSPATWTH